MSFERRYIDNEIGAGAGLRTPLARVGAGRASGSRGIRIGSGLHSACLGTGDALRRGPTVLVESLTATR